MNVGARTHLRHKSRVDTNDCFVLFNVFSLDEGVIPFMLSTMEIGHSVVNKEIKIRIMS